MNDTKIKSQIKEVKSKHDQIILDRWNKIQNRIKDVDMRREARIAALQKRHLDLPPPPGTVAVNISSEIASTNEIIEPASLPSESSVAVKAKKKKDKRKEEVEADFDLNSVQTVKSPDAIFIDILKNSWKDISLDTATVLNNVNAESTVQNCVRSISQDSMLCNYDSVQIIIRHCKNSNTKMYAAVVSTVQIAITNWFGKATDLLKTLAKEIEASKLDSASKNNYSIFPSSKSCVIFFCSVFVCSLDSKAIFTGRCANLF